MDGSVDFVSDTIKAALLTNSHTVAVDTDDFWDDVSGEECADGDYSAQTVSGKTITLTSNKVRFDCADIDFGNSVTISARYLVLYKDTGTPATSNLLWIADLNTGGGNVSSSSSDFYVQINANGIYEVTPNV